MNVTEWIHFKCTAFKLRYRAFAKFYFFRRMDVKLYSGLIIKKNAGKRYFGKGFVAYDRVIFEIYNKLAQIEIGDNCVLSYGVIVSCNEKIVIGNNVWIGEYTSIRDTTHVFNKRIPMGAHKDISEIIRIGNNVWIGRGCLILPGTQIGDNVIIAANSVVKGDVQSNSLYGGCPAKFIKHL